MSSVATGDFDGAIARGEKLASALCEPFKHVTPVPKSKAAVPHDKNGYLDFVMSQAGTTPGRLSYTTSGVVRHGADGVIK